MINEITVAAKQVGLDLIDMSDTLAKHMETWSDVLARNPESITATTSAGFINKPSVAPEFELTIDVQMPPDEQAVLRTWVIETKIGDDKQEFFNNIQLTFEADNKQVRDLVAKGRSITREDIRLLLQNQTSQLARITVTNGRSERYDFTITELSQHPDDAAKVNHALQTVLQTLKQSVANSLH